MVAVRPDDVKAKLKSEVQPTRELIEEAKVALMAAAADGAEPKDSRRLVADYVLANGAVRVPEIYCHTDMGIDQQCSRAGLYWTYTISGLRALSELVKDDFLDATTNHHLVVSQKFTTAVDGGGTSGSWHLDDFDLTFPTPVRVSPATRKFSPPPLPERQQGRVIGDGPRMDWDSVPVGMHPFLTAAKARGEAVDKLRDIGYKLDEAVEVSDGLERHIMSEVRAKLDEAIDALQFLGRGADELVTSEADELVGRLKEAGRYIEAALRVINGFAKWRGVAVLLKMVLGALGLEIPADLGD